MSLFRRKPKPLIMCYYGNPVLKKKSKEIPSISKDICTFAERMIVTMDEHDGIGLAAPQVGRNINMFVVSVPMPGEDENPPTSPGELALIPQMPVVMRN
ncbi:MAG: peptide deformylase, partial [Lentisphaeria bacterium]|nr:peptide deformylase [Lentisphaeria bacterium]NQZ67659.1 peptide deformylase [Lentisphaeria bacterium]